jgi:hypothetical protein
VHQELNKALKNALHAIDARIIQFVVILATEMSVVHDHSFFLAITFYLV